MGTLWIDLLFRDGMVDKDHQTPIMAIDLRIQPTGILDSGQKLQDMVAQIGLALRNQSLADMAGHDGNVAHDHIYIVKHLVVDALKHIVGLVLFFRHDQVGIVDQS